MHYPIFKAVILLVLLNSSISSSLSSRERSPSPQHLGHHRLKLGHSTEVNLIEEIIGTAIYENYLLLHSLNALTIIDITQQEPQPQYKYIIGFQCIKLVPGFHKDQLLFLSYNQHCVRELTFSSRDNKTFSGSCDNADFVDGRWDRARFNKPLDILREENSSYAYVADYNNDCVRRVDRDGAVQRVVSLHHKPFKLAAGLFVAADQHIFQVIERLNTYARFVSEVELHSMVSCDHNNLVVLTKDLCIQILPLDRDVNSQPTQIDGSFDSLLCYNNKAAVLKVTKSSSPSSKSIVRILTLDMTESVTSTSTSIHGATSQSNFTSINITTQPIYYNHTSSGNLTFHNLTESNDLKFSTSDWHPDFTPEPLDNHAHPPFDHLPSSYTERNYNIEVVVPVVLALLTLVSVALGLLCVIKRRKMRMSASHGDTAEYTNELNFHNDQIESLIKYSVCSGQVNGVHQAEQFVRS